MSGHLARTDPGLDTPAITPDAAFAPTLAPPLLKVPVALDFG